MSVNLRDDQCCKALVSGQRCLRPASELGGLCSAHWRGLSPASRDYLRWEASWASVPAADEATLDGWDIVRAAEAMLGE